MRKLLRPSSWIACILRLDCYQAYRRWQGSHWELWWVDTVNSYVWHKLSKCTQQPQSELPPDFWKRRNLDEVVHMIFRDRPTPLCRGTPVCEDYTGVGDPLDSEFIDG